MFPNALGLHESPKLCDVFTRQLAMGQVTANSRVHENLWASSDTWSFFVVRHLILNIFSEIALNFPRLVKKKSNSFWATLVVRKWKISASSGCKKSHDVTSPYLLVIWFLFKKLLGADYHKTVFHWEYAFCIPVSASVNHPSNHNGLTRDTTIRLNFSLQNCRN